MNRKMLSIKGITEGLHKNEEEKLAKQAIRHGSLEEVPEWEKKLAQYKQYKTFKELSLSNSLRGLSRVAAENLTNKLNQEYGDETAKFKFSNWAGYGKDGAYEVTVTMPDPNDFRDILDSEGKLLPRKDM